MCLTLLFLQFLDKDPLDNAQVQQKKSRLRKDTRQSTSSSSPIKNKTSTRKTRSSSRAKSANGDEDTFDSSHRGIDPLDNALILKEGNQIDIEGPMYTSLGSIDFVKNDKVFIEKIRKNVDDLKK